MLSLTRSIFTISLALLGCPFLAHGISSELQNILKNTHRSNAYSYPTDLTRDIFPVSPLAGQMDGG
jgi:hypothetical protein